MGFKRRFGYSLLIFCSSSVPVAAEVLDTYVCQSCTDNAARDLAKAKFDQSTCNVVKTGEGAANVTESLTRCDVKNKDLVILDPAKKKVRKYRASASYPHPNHKTVRVSPVVVSSDELSTAEIFFDFYDEVMTATNDGILVLSVDDFLSTQGISVPNYSASSSSNNADPRTCTVVSTYMRDADSQVSAQKYIKTELASRLRGVNPNNTGENNNATSGLRVKGSQGDVSFNIEWDNEQMPYVVAVGEGDNFLMFDLGFTGVVSRGNVTGTNIDLSLNDRLSKVDGIRFSAVFRENGTLDDSKFSSTEDKQCLRKLVEGIADRAPWGTYIGDGMESSNEVTMHTRNGHLYCAQTVSYKACSLDSDGDGCTNSIYRFPVVCPKENSQIKPAP